MIKQYRLYHLLFLKKIKLVNPLMGQPTFFFLYDFLNLILVASSEDAEQIEEQVDEVEIQGQCTEQGELLGSFTYVVLCLEHLLDLLAVPGCQTRKDCHTHITQDVIKSRTLQEQVDYGRDNQANQSHEEDLADRGQVLFGGITVESRYAKGSRSDEEYLCDDHRTVDVEDG